MARSVYGRYTAIGEKESSGRVYSVMATGYLLAVYNTDQARVLFIDDEISRLSPRWEEGNDFLGERCRHCYLYFISAFYLILGISAIFRYRLEIRSGIFRRFLLLVIAASLIRSITLAFWFLWEQFGNEVVKSPTLFIILFDLGSFLFLTAYLLSPLLWLVNHHGDDGSNSCSFHFSISIVFLMLIITWVSSIDQKARIGCRGFSLFMTFLLYSFAFLRTLLSTCRQPQDVVYDDVYGAGHILWSSTASRVIKYIICLLSFLLNIFVSMLCVVHLHLDPIRMRDNMLNLTFFLGEMLPAVAVFNIPWLIAKLCSLRRHHPNRLNSIRTQTTITQRRQPPSYLVEDCPRFLPQASFAAGGRPSSSTPSLPSLHRAASSVPSRSNATIKSIDGSSLSWLKINRNEKIPCVFCRVANQTTGFLHDKKFVCKCVCRDCSRRMNEPGLKCPICRDVVTAIVKDI